MALRKEDLHKLIDELSETDQKTAFDFLKFLINRSEKNPDFWESVESQEPMTSP